ncbi:uncharacterized protein LOC116307697 [Actinia tenebrosa]|uniref:Uncharacterized protein LOC116307697 n=1 Tax=Actinia tenebrosa TaxID=6105 RepID=A0A6P8J2R6_ACTTE|nr:uncharacterized protein LOC116307697 [Actinia tenebrosa]
MRPLVTLALLGLLVYYVSGRAIMVENDRKVTDSAMFDNCMLKCEDDQDNCEKECGNGIDADAVNCRSSCKDAYDECTGGSSSRDDNVPYYKREVKRSCQDLVKRTQETAPKEKDDIDYEFVMRQ